MKEIEATEYVNSNEVCKKLGIQASTLRKYAGMLDERATTEFYFHRNSSNDRLYTKKDIAVLERLIELKNSPNYTLETAANEIVGMSYNGDTSTDIALNEEMEGLSAEIQALRFFITHQNDYFKRYQEALEQKDQQIERLEAVVAKLTDIQEAALEFQQKTLIKESIEIENESGKKNAGFFKRFFS